MGPQFGSVIVLQLAKRHALSSPTCNNFSNPSMAMTNMFGWDNNSHKTATQPCCTKNSICRSEPLRERGKGEKGKRGKGKRYKEKQIAENKDKTHEYPTTTSLFSLVSCSLCLSLCLSFFQIQNVLLPRRCVQQDPTGFYFHIRISCRAAR